MANNNSESNEFRVALESLQNQITTRFPTRDDIKTALESLQMQLDHRFVSAGEVYLARIEALEKLFTAETRERDKAVMVLTDRVTRQLAQVDESLREHIRGQLEQIHASLESADKLEVGRVQTINEKVETLNSGCKDIITSLSSQMSVVNDASEKAIAKAEASVEKRFDSNDKAAQALRELVNSAMPRAEVITMIKAATDKIGDLTDRINRTEGKGAGMGQIWGYIVGAGGVIVAVVALFGWIGTLSPKVDRNTERIIDELARRPALAPTPAPPIR